MATYTLQWLERKRTSTGKEKMDVFVTNEQGNEIKNVSIWSDFPEFNRLMPGSIVQGDLVPSKNPSYGPTLYPAKTYKSFGTKSAVGEKMIEKKQEGIKLAQENKAEGIKASSTIRMAVDIAIARGVEIERMDESQVKAEIIKWRNFFLHQWDNINPELPF